VMWTWRKIGLSAAVTVLSVIALVVAIDQLVLPWIVSMSKTISVPNVVGRTLDQAQAELQQAGLNVVDVRERYTNDYKAGVVMSQLPYSGAVVKEGRRAYLTVSEGIELIKVPRVIGLSQRDAQILLMRNGLILGSVSTSDDPAAALGTVLWQSVIQGAQVQKESVVDVVVSNGGGKPVPNLMGLTVSEAERVLLVNGFSLGTIIERTSQAFESGVVMAQRPAADKLAPAGTSVTLIIAN